MKKTPPKTAAQHHNQPSLEHFSDADLIEAWNRDRHRDAFAVLVRRYSKLVLSVCRRKCGSVSDADDAYQTTFLYLAKKSGSIRHPECLPGWLQRVAQRAAVATLPADRMNASLSQEPTVEDDALSRISQQHDAMLLDEELARLPEHYRSAIVLHLYDGESLESLANRFETTIGSLRGRLQRGKKMLAARLRRRGLVPVVAFAAAGATTVGSTEACEASQPLIESLTQPDLPEPPIDPHLFEPLVSNGVNLMSPVNLIVATTALGAIVTLATMPSPFDQASAQSPQKTLVVAGEETNPPTPSIDQDSSSFIAQVDFGENPARRMNATTEDPTDRSGSNQNTSDSNATVNDPFADSVAQRMVWEKEYPPREPSSKLAEQIRQAMDESYVLEIPPQFVNLASSLEQQLDVPVLLNKRAIKFAQVDESTPVNYASQNEPLRTSLRRILRPLGLKASISDEGIVITADHGELVHHDIGKYRWVNVDDAKMRVAAEKLSSNVSLDFPETPLDVAIAEVSATIGLPFIIDHRAMEEIGLDKATSITCRLNDVEAINFLSIMLRDLDLTFSVTNDVFVVTTVEAAEENPLSRIYFLEGLAINGDFDSLINMIEGACVPDTWESLGGNSTLSPMNNTRPALLVSTSYDVHRQIEKLLDGFRESNFLEEREPTFVEIPAPSGDSGNGATAQSGGMF